MEIATYLLFLLGLLGAADIVFFHSISHGIRNHPNSRHELISHSLRGPTYGALFILIPNFAMFGSFYWILFGLLIFDFGISIWDFSIERESRRFLGGLPTGEYLLHIMIAMLFGAFVAMVFLSTKEWCTMTTQVIFQPVKVHYSLRITLTIMAVLVIISGFQDAIAVLRLKDQPKWIQK